MTGTAPKYRLYGTTDDVTTCQWCFKPDLKGTVMIQPLDLDGNPGELIYAGSTCAAKLLAEQYGVKTTGRKLLDLARGADRKRREAVEHSRAMVAYYEPFEQLPRLADFHLANEYVKANRGYFRNHPDELDNALVLARDCLRRHREIIATDGAAAL